MYKIKGMICLQQLMKISVLIAKLLLVNCENFMQENKECSFCFSVKFNNSTKRV